VVKRSFLTLLVSVLPVLLVAQRPPVLPPGGLIQLQVPQAPVDVSSPVTATASFDPPVVHVGEKTCYRVNIDATESSVFWLSEPAFPNSLALESRASGQITQMQGGRFRPLATFLYELTATNEGHISVPSFAVNVSGTEVDIPGAALEVVPKNLATQPCRRLRVAISATNIFLGEPFHVRVILPGGPANEIEALREVGFRGEGLMTDKTATQQIIEPVDIDGQLKISFVSDMVVTPLAAGPLTFSVQGFTAGHEFTPPLSVHGQFNFSGGVSQYVLLTSDPKQITVRPLPVESELPGYTGAIGKFSQDPPRLSTNRVHVGEPVQLKVSFHGEGELSRFVPPEAPRSRDWQIIAAPPPSSSFTLIPLSDESQQTPAIPFCYFDPAIGKFVDLTILPQPITVVGESLPAELATGQDTPEAGVPTKLTAMAPSPGVSIGALKPLQLQAWCLCLQLVPAFGFFALWQWDRRRRYLEAHPEIVRRNKARRDLRRERQFLAKAHASGDVNAYVHHAARAMSIAVAPYYPANPRALVGADILAQLPVREGNVQSAETVKLVFAAADAQYATVPQMKPDLLGLQPKVEVVLQQLEEQL